MPGRPLPTGVVTILMTDIEGSTAMLQALGDAWDDVIADHYRIVTTSVTAHRGVVFGSRGDGLCAVFEGPEDAASAAVDTQRRIRAHPWPQRTAMRIRVGLHTGVARVVEGEYVGLAVHQAARLTDAANGGQIIVSQDTVDALDGRLPDRAGLTALGPHQLKDLREAVGVWQVDHPDLPSTFGPLRTLSVLPHNLPLQLTSFVGRTDELLELEKAVATSRLVTLSGPGGVGKTRLAVQAAAAVLDEFSDGVWLTELAPLGKGEPVEAAVAASIGVRQPPGGSVLDGLLDHLRSRQLLCVWDNCEHLLDPVSELCRTILERCPEVHILATGREPIGMLGETVQIVEPLPVPDVTETHPEAALAHPAIELFRDRATAAQPDFALDHDNTADVVRICHAVDGLPLAVELAASRVRDLRVGEIASHIDERLSLLDRGNRAAPPRQRTVRALIDWSYDLLEAPRRGAFADLGVFVGSFDPSAVEIVCEVEDAGALLEHLASKSLLRRLPTDEPRYAMLEVVREYARSVSGEGDQTRRRHLRWALRLADDAYAGFRGPGHAEAIARLDLDHANLRTALDFALAADDIDAAVAMVDRLVPYWHHRGHLTLGRGSLDRVLERIVDEQTRRHARLLSGRSALLADQGDLEGAIADSRRALEVATACGDERSMRSAYGDLGNYAWRRGDHAAAREYLQRSLDLTNDPRSTAATLNSLGAVHWGEGDFDRAEELFRRVLAIREELGDTPGVAAALSNLANVAMKVERHDEARELLERSVAVMEELGDRSGLAHVLHSLGAVLADTGDLTGASEVLEHSLVISREIEDRRGQAKCLDGLAGIAYECGDYERAVEIGEQELAIDRELGVERSIGNGLTRLGKAKRKLGQLDEARALLEEAVGIHARLANPDGECTARNYLARTCWKLGATDAARDHIAGSLELQRALGRGGPIGADLEVVATILRDEVEADEIVVLLSAAATIAASVGRAPDDAEHRAALSELEPRCTDLEDARRRGEAMDKGEAIEHALALLAAQRRT